MSSNFRELRELKADSMIMPMRAAAMGPAVVAHTTIPMTSSRDLMSRLIRSSANVFTYAAPDTIPSNMTIGYSRKRTRSESSIETD